MPTLFDLMRPPTGATADQVMRQAKSAPLDSIFMLGGNGRPTTYLGEVGALDAMEDPLYAPPMQGAPEPSTPRLPLPPEVETAMAGSAPVQMPPQMDIRDAPEQGTPTAAPTRAPVVAPASGGGLPVPTTGAQPVPTTAAPPAAAPAATAYQQFRQQQRAMSMKLAEKMMTGSPAMRVQGLQLLFQVQKDYQDELAENQKLVDAQKEQQRQLLTIDSSVADDTDKERAKTLVQLGGRPQDVAEALRFNNQGATDRKDRREQFHKWGQQVTTTSRDLGTMEIQAQKVDKLLDEGDFTTGTGAWFAQWVPGSDANKLNAALEPLRALTGYGYLQELREQSKTGGAVGNVTENETRWLMGIQGGLDPITSDPDSLRENVRTIVEGKRIVLEMRKLAPALEAGDPAAWETYSQLTQQLAQNGATVRARIQAEKDHRAVEPEDADIEGRY